jgi:hypothetical protein
LLRATGIFILGGSFQEAIYDALRDEAPERSACHEFGVPGKVAERDESRGTCARIPIAAHDVGNGGLGKRIEERGIVCRQKNAEPSLQRDTSNSIEELAGASRMDPVVDLFDDDHAAWLDGVQRRRDRQHSQGSIGEEYGLLPSLVAAETLLQPKHHVSPRSIDETDIRDVLLWEVSNERQELLAELPLAHEFVEHAAQIATVSRKAWLLSKGVSTHCPRLRVQEQDLLECVAKPSACRRDLDLRRLV